MLSLIVSDSTCYVNCHEFDVERNLITSEIYNLSSDLKKLGCFFRGKFITSGVGRKIVVNKFLGKRELSSTKRFLLIVDLQFHEQLGASDWFFCSSNLQFRVIESVSKTWTQINPSMLTKLERISQSHDLIQLCSSSMFNKRLNIHQFYSVNEPL